MAAIRLAEARGVFARPDLSRVQDFALRIKIFDLDQREDARRESTAFKRALLSRVDQDPQKIFPTFFPPPSPTSNREIEQAFSGPASFESTVGAEEALAILSTLNFDSGTLGPEDLRSLHDADTQ